MTHLNNLNWFKDSTTFSALQSSRRPSVLTRPPTPREMIRGLSVRRTGSRRKEPREAGTGCLVAALGGQTNRAPESFVHYQRNKCPFLWAHEENREVTFVCPDLGITGRWRRRLCPQRSWRGAAGPSPQILRRTHSAALGGSFPVSSLGKTNNHIPPRKVKRTHELNSLTR